MIRTPAHSHAGMVQIPAGSFYMGCDSGAEYEQPIREVFLDSYLMDATPITNGQFVEFVEATGYKTTAERVGAARGFSDGQYKVVVGLSWKSYFTSDREDHPVLLVSWEDAAAFADWAGKSLPTEAQWERAARGGQCKMSFPWGDSTPDGTQCNFAREPSEIPPTTPVTAFPPNSLGLYDMVGNVWQWCIDYYRPEAYNLLPGVNPLADAPSPQRVRRGGAWNVIQPFRLRVANRGALDPQAVAPNMGFRCVQHAPQLDQMEYTDAHFDNFGQVQSVLSKLRPAMEADGGGVELLGITDGIVRVRLLGTCLTCPSISLTLKEGIEKTLRRELPWIVAVERL